MAKRNKETENIIEKISESSLHEILPNSFGR